MTGNTALQNPANKVGRNSGAGPTGISESEPTRAEAERGVEPMRVGQTDRGYGRWGMGLGVGALFGAGVAAYTRYRAGRGKGLRERVMRRVGLGR